MERVQMLASRNSTVGLLMSYKSTILMLTDINNIPKTILENFISTEQSRKEFQSHSLIFTHHKLA